MFPFCCCTSLSSLAVPLNQSLCCLLLPFDVGDQSEYGIEDAYSTQQLDWSNRIGSHCRCLGICDQFGIVDVVWQQVQQRQRYPFLSSHQAQTSLHAHFLGYRCICRGWSIHDRRDPVQLNLPEQLPDCGRIIIIFADYFGFPFHKHRTHDQ